VTGAFGLAMASWVVRDIQQNVVNAHKNENEQG